MQGVGVEDEVVAFAVSPGTGDAEAEAGGLEGEGEFGKFSAAFGGEFALEGRVGREEMGPGGFSARRWAASAR